MSVDLCFYYDQYFRDFWDQVLRTYKMGVAYEIETPDNVIIGPWTAINSMDDLPDSKPKIFFSPSYSPLIPGTIALDDFDHPKDAIYCFGSDEHQNGKVECEACVYIPTPKAAPFWSAQAASIVMYSWWRQHGNS